MSSRSVLLHPLCLASICDHYTRVIVGGTKLSRDSPVIGILLGNQHDGLITLFDISDLIFDLSNDNHDVDMNIILNIAEIQRIVTLRTAVFTSYEVVGWFAVSAEILPQYSHLHSLIESNFAPNPLFLLLNPSIVPIDSKVLPIRVFELTTSTEVGTKQKHSSFIDVPFRLETGQVEKLAIDEVTKVSTADGGSSVEIQNQAMRSSVRTLGEKIDIIINWLKAMQAGEIPADAVVMRRAAKIVRYLNTTMMGRDLDAAVMRQIDECLAITYLSSATKAAGQINEIADTYSRVYSEKTALSI